MFQVITKKNFKMILNIKKTLLLTVMSFSVTAVTAQNARSGYFVDDYTYRFQMNPAIGNSKNFVSMPGLSNFNISENGNLHLTDVLYNIDGKTTTFLNPGVNASEMLDKIEEKNRIGVNLKANILSTGFKAWGGYNTITVSVNGNADIMIPKAFFSLAKEGLTNKTYDIRNLGATSSAYAEIGLGHSHDINSNIRVGATLKFLVGAGYAKTKINEANLSLGEDYWTVTTNANLEASIKSLQYETELNDNTGHQYVNGVDVDNFGVNGYGLGLDLGVVYKTPVKGLTVSAAVLDLGFINWKNNMVASTNGVKTVNTDRYTFEPNDNAENGPTFDDEWDKLRDDLSAIYELEDMGDKGSITRALNATVNIGAQYDLPFYNRLNLGLLNTTRISGEYTWTDFRLSANIAPCKIFSASVNGGMGTFGASFGWMLNLHVTGFNFFVGSDHTPWKLAKQGVPLSSNASLNLGINFLF